MRGTGSLPRDRTASPGPSRAAAPAHSGEALAASRRDRFPVCRARRRSSHRWPGAGAWRPLRPHRRRCRHPSPGRPGSPPAIGPAQRRGPGRCPAQGHQGPIGGGDGGGVRRGPRRCGNGPEVRLVVPDDGVDRLEDCELHDRAQRAWKKGLVGGAATVASMIAFQSVTASAWAVPAPYRTQSVTIGLQRRFLMLFIVTCPFLGQRVPVERTGHTPERLGEFRITNRDGDAAAHRRRDSRILLFAPFRGRSAGRSGAAPGADRRRVGAGPVGSLLGGNASPAA